MHAYYKWKRIQLNQFLLIKILFYSMLFYTHYVLIYGNISSPGLIKKKKKLKFRLLLLACIDEGITVLRKGGGAKAKRVNPSTCRSTSALWLPFTQPTYQIKNVCITPRSDQHVTSPCDVHMFSSKQLMRILKLIRKKF